MIPACRDRLSLIPFLGIRTLLFEIVHFSRMRDFKEKNLLLCAVISMAIETFRYVIVRQLDYNDLNRLFLCLSVSHQL